MTEEIKAYDVPSDKPNIYQRLNKIRREVEYLKKDATVTGYKAITHDFVTSAIRRHLIDNGVLTIPRQVSAELRDTGKTTKGGVPFTAYIGMYEFDFVNEDDPSDMVTVRVGAISEDTADKGPGGAISYAMKYAFLKILNIETGDSEESRHDQEPKHIDTKPIAEDMILTIETIVTDHIEAGKIKDEKDFDRRLNRLYKVKKIEELTETQGEELIKKLGLIK